MFRKTRMKTGETDEHFVFLENDMSIYSKSLRDKVVTPMTLLLYAII